MRFPFVMLPLPTMKKMTTLLLIFQFSALVIFISLYQMNTEKDYTNQLKQIEYEINGGNVVVGKTKKSDVVLAHNNICLDSEGVYRACDDDEYLKKVESDNLKGDSAEDEVDDKHVGNINILKNHEDIVNVSVVTAAYHENRFQLDNYKDDFDYYDDDDTTGLSPEASKKKLEEIREKRFERAEEQFSGMGSMTKMTSAKVRNADKRFVSDKRILFSETYEQVDDVEDVKLLVIITSAAKRRARRDSIRATWFTECSQNAQVKCFFFTDDVNSENLKNVKQELLRESKTYNDVIFQPIDIGLQFGYRILYQMQWAMAHYRFQYLLRVDDDTIVCLHRLLHDLQYIRTTELQWGVLHCMSDDAVYIDEGLTMFSRDVVMRFLSQNPFKMRCHVYGDQQIAIWIRDLHLDANALYMHDERIHHTPPASKMLEYFNELDDICATHIIIHGVYPGDMEDFWAKPRSRNYLVFKPKPLTEYCDKELSYVWHAFGYRYRHQPKYCYKRPKWKTPYMQEADGTFGGRENRPDLYESDDTVFEK